MSSRIDEVTLKRAAGAFWQHAWLDDENYVWASEDGLMAALCLILGDVEGMKNYRLVSEHFKFGPFEVALSSLEDCLEEAILKSQVPLTTIQKK